MSRRVLAALVVVVSWAAPVSAQDAPKLDLSGFSGEGRSAASAFAEGDAAEAARRYRVLLDARGPSADLLYNLGTAHAYAEAPGRAIWALERARTRAPRDAAIVHNLEVVRQRVRVARLGQKIRGELTEGEPEGVALRRALTAWTPLEVAAPLLVVNALMFALLAWRRKTESGGFRDAQTVGVGVLAVLVLGLALMLGARQWAAHTIDVAVVLEARTGLVETPAPGAKAQRHVDVFEGAFVRVLDKRDDGWVRVRLASGSEGWIDARRIGAID